MSEKRWLEFAPEIAGEIDENYRSIADSKTASFQSGGFRITGYISPEDARLMATAPELLEALEEMLESYPASSKALKAIKKARGEE